MRQHKIKTLWKENPGRGSMLQGSQSFESAQLASALSARDLLVSLLYASLCKNIMFCTVHL